MTRPVTTKARERTVDGFRIYYDDHTARRMAGIRQRDTAPELAVRAIFRSLGLHYRVRNRDLPGSPDLANRHRAWAVFVHGCYWHRHQGCRRATTPKRNAAFWKAKFLANVERDRRSTDQLCRRGFRVLVIWECETENSALLYSKVRGLRERTS